jgi:hypothetical protein
MFREATVSLCRTGSREVPLVPDESEDERRIVLLAGWAGEAPATVVAPSTVQ